MKPPTISAVMRVYNAEEYIGESLAAILSQSRPADEVVVVDDGSTDGTLEELARFRSEIRLVRQPNRGYAEALNRCFREARGDYVANCDSDDIWEPDKLARQVDALLAHPEIDIAFGPARFFGEREGEWGMIRGEDRSTGIMGRRRFARTMFRANPCPSTSTLIRRRLYQQLGPFLEHHLVVEDYEYWMRALRAGAVFYYDPAILVRCRRHDNNVSSDQLALHRSDFVVRSRYADLVDSRWFAHTVLARDLFHIARDLSDRDRMREARAVFVDALRHRLTLRGLAWVLVLSAPEPYRRELADGLVSVKRGLMSAARR
jgi:glycosyltransferase involved in cell wall biosynthesis